MAQTDSTNVKFTITDLAQQTGVSIGTVSRVLNQRGRVAATTRQRVLAAARAANFRPRVCARRATVALVCDRLRYATQGGYVSQLLHQMTDAITGRSLSVELYTERNIEHLGQRYVDGVIAMAWDRQTFDVLGKLRNVPVVVVNRFDLDRFSVVGTDQRQGGRIVAEHLLDRGHRQVKIIAEAPTWGARQRRLGFEEAFTARSLSSDPDWIVFTDHQPVYGAVKQALADDTTAIFLAGEDLCLEVSHILKRLLKLRIGRDISVVAMENPSVSRFLDPPETTLCQPLGEMARQAVELVSEQIDAGKAEPRRVVLDNQLIQRESVADLSAQPDARGSSPTPLL